MPLDGERRDADLAVDRDELTAFKSAKILFANGVTLVEDLQDRGFVSDVRFESDLRQQGLKKHQNIKVHAGILYYWTRKINCRVLALYG